jgi:uncharacterized protein YbcV (DUF1398 family)
MDPQRIAIAQNCLAAAYDKTMAFPQIVGTLIQSGFEGYIVDFRRNTTTYYLPEGDSVVLDNHASEATVDKRFDADGVSLCVKWAQANPPDYNYAEFCKKVKGSGCAGYIVSFLGQRVVYFGRTAEIHVEHFPQ